MRGIRIIAGILLVATLFVLAGCSGAAKSTQSPKPVSETNPAVAPISAPASPPAETTPTPTPAKFEVVSLFVPSPIMAGENVNVGVLVKNVGGSNGTYPVTLTVDGVSVETKEVTVEPGGWQTIIFSLTKATHGTYKIGAGNLTSTLLVKEKLIELKHDDGKAETSLTSRSQERYGYLVVFLPPSKPFIIKQVQLVGMSSGTIMVWDKDMKPIYESTYSSKAGTAPWREVEIPNIEVNDKFYIHFFATWGGMSVDTSTANQGSYLTENIAGTFRPRYQWYYSLPGGAYIDQSNVNWMIRVYGTEGSPK